MFLTLLLVTFAIALAVAAFAARLFDRAIAAILNRIIAEEISSAWARYIKFAIYVVGVSGGVRIWELEKYITPVREAREPVALTADRWILEVYRTIIATLQSIAWLLLVVFAVALIGIVVVKGQELKHSKR
jgi:hypothetical protein